MSYDMVDIASSGLQAERIKMDVIASNIANANATHNADGDYSPYRRKEVQFQTIFDQELDRQLGVKVQAVVEDSTDLNKVYEPSNPDADERGYVLYPNVQISREMVDMMSAKSSYDANIAVIRTYKQMYGKALEM